MTKAKSLYFGDDAFKRELFAYEIGQLFSDEPPHPSSIIEWLCHWHIEKKKEER